MTNVRQTGARRRTDRIEFQLVYLATLPAFLIGSLVNRLLARPKPGSARLTVVGEAKAAARTCGSFALMG